MYELLGGGYNFLIKSMTSCFITIFLFLLQFQNLCGSNQQLKMGISGLLQFIKDAAEPINVKKYKGQTVAVDTYCWLHKGAFSCAEKLAKGEPTDQ